MQHVRRKVDLLVKKHDTTCPYKITNESGIHLFFEPLGKILGFYSKHYRIKTIHINALTTEDERLFILSHELGHAMLHPDANTPFLKKHTLFSTNQIEKEANFFAIELLAKKLASSTTTLEEAMVKYKIPKQLLLEYKNF